MLTIQPGVVVKFNAGTSLTIGNGANTGALGGAGFDYSEVFRKAKRLLAEKKKIPL